ncbi:hypothetical protein BWQ96_00556 [Gracilariopsis chorda]|uniref:Uncharacterized protein n=1 Tax=Gracilariopsis chorda TaxID=448386 RepID=A0A2V3J5H3_9FLOR|nr:hypothetical protein BWQ96_00556 [Gracilariopsis chorda]|eukprot:PXF49678.1 hypothetical protein BWQ96_00556 [Gracilariopsis chorda]
MASTGSLLSFSEVLEAQLDDSLPYPTLKRLLRTLKSYHPAYPDSQHPASGKYSALSQTQRTQSRRNTEHESQNQQQDNNRKAGNQSLREHESNIAIDIEHNSIPELNDSLPIHDPDENERKKEDLQAVATQQVHFLHPAREGNEQISKCRAENRLREEHRSPLKEITSLSGDNPKKRPYCGTTAGTDENNNTTPLKRRRSRSRRRPLRILSSSEESEDECASIMDNVTNIRKEYTHHRRATTKAFSARKGNECIKESIPKEVGELVNKTIYKLIKQSDGGGHVSWCDLRGMLMLQNRAYAEFCGVVDKLFRQSDPLASCPTPESSQSSKGSKSCIFYSNRFWDEVWRDYLESSDDPGRTKLRPNKN